MVEIELEGPAKNALSSAMLVHLREELRRADGAPVLLRGSGDAFSAGLDLREVASFEPDGMEAFLRLLEGTVIDLFRYPAPTVAAVNGHAIAGGCIVALVCDRRLAADTERARIGLNEVALGLRFPPRLLEVVRYRIPPASQEQVLMGAGLHGPLDALDLGLVDAVVPADDLLDVARAELETLAALDRVAYAGVKEDLRGDVGRHDPTIEARFLRDVVPVWTGDALKQRIAAFLNRRG